MQESKILLSKFWRLDILFLFSATGFCFIFASFLMLLTTICFILGAPAQIVCKSIETGDLYSKVCGNHRYVLMAFLNARSVTMQSKSPFAIISLVWSSNMHHSVGLLTSFIWLHVKMDRYLKGLGHFINISTLVNWNSKQNQVSQAEMHHIFKLG